MQFKKLCRLASGYLFLSATAAVAQSGLELPIDADNCAIHRALSPETSGSCTNSIGLARGIVLRIDDALEAKDTSLPKGTMQSFIQRPISPVVRVASATGGTTVRIDVPHRPASHAAAESNDGYFIQFAFDSATLEPRFKAHLNRLSEVLTVQEMATSCIKIIGHTDTVGHAKYNLKLSRRRAKSVAGYLNGNRGIPASRISIEAAGEQRPLPSIKGNDALNRRVEFATKESISGC